MASVDNDLERIASTRVLVVGDLMLDRYWFGEVERISPEAPVPVVQVTTTEERMGGAGNVAQNVTALGAQSGLIGIVGNDHAGQLLGEVADRAGIWKQLVMDHTITTCVKQRIVARHQQLLRADFEQVPDRKSITGLHDALEQNIERYDVVVLSDYGKGALARCRDLVALCHAHDKPVLVDPKGADFSRYHGADMITPNRKEFELVAGQVESEEEFDNQARKVVEQYELNQLLVTLSERGMKLFDRDGTVRHSPARSREVFDVSGAGDTVIGMMAMCIGAGIDISRALHYANIAAGVVVSKLGTATANLEEIRQAMAREKSV